MAEEEEESILYDLLVPAEWTVEPEPLTNVILDNQQTSFGSNYCLLPSERDGQCFVAQGYPDVSFHQYFIPDFKFIKLTLEDKCMRRTATRCSLPASLIRLINSQMSWQLSANEDGQLLAVLQDNYIEIRTFRDEF
ncbi:putative neuroblastoma-amplified sequence [Apostichopus japonicus]|uniref:Putative neuroblastoma-amplified sequence n=1 Tax=Stichopus japonicus TaxID=307972 RepID=A0A2G8LGX7_STIJA|nr:putative neuroblastoma-amplified sequence [Apostichopus japonicus]